jgi:Uma2 family endonuclease
MPVVASEYLEAIEHLPAGGVLSFEDVSWEDYETLLADLGESYSVRIFYDRGRMEIMAPSYEHDKPIDILHRLLITLSDELDIDVEGCGSTTLKLERTEKGAEPDKEFYVQNASRIIGNETLDLRRDPPPDLVIEVDRTSSSIDKFSIYASLGVPEIWRLFKGKLTLYHLIEDRYQESQHSLAFPFITPQTLMEFVTLGQKEGERKAAKAFRDWIRQNRSS